MLATRSMYHDMQYLTIAMVELYFIFKFRLIKMKIIEKINSKVDNGETFYSFEYFPPKTDEGVKNLHQRQIYMKSFDPLFCDITWGAGGSTADLTLTIAEKMQKEVGRLLPI